MEKLKKHGFETNNFENKTKQPKIGPKIKKYRFSYDFPVGFPLEINERAGS